MICRPKVESILAKVLFFKLRNTRDFHFQKSSIFKYSLQHLRRNHSKYLRRLFHLLQFDGDVPRPPSYGVYISQLIRIARVCSNVDDFNNRTLFLTAKLLKQGYRYHKIGKAFSKFYHRHSELIVKHKIRLKTLLQQGISEPIFYGD